MEEVDPMKNKLLILSYLLVVIITLAACTNDKNNKLSTTIPESAFQGKIEGLEFGIGDSTEEIITLWGMPDKYDYYLGGLYLKYTDRNVIYFTSAVFKEGQIDHGNVVTIAVFGQEKSYFGVKIGNKFKDMEEVLGKPSSIVSDQEHEDSELFRDSWVAYYDAGDYEIAFRSSHEDGPIQDVYLLKR